MTRVFAGPVGTTLLVDAGRIAVAHVVAWERGPEGGLGPVDLATFDGGDVCSPPPRTERGSRWRGTGIRPAW